MQLDNTNDTERRVNAMLQSLERQRNEALSREVQKDVAIAVLEGQLADANKRYAELEEAHKLAAFEKATRELAVVQDQAA